MCYARAQAAELEFTGETHALLQIHVCDYDNAILFFVPLFLPL